MEYNFEWDPAKALANREKHGVSFLEAVGVFKDPMALTVYDPDDSNPEEDRWITVGQVEGRSYLLVVHTYQEEGSESITIRMISARPATRHEIKQYEEG